MEKKGKEDGGNRDAMQGRKEKMALNWASGEEGGFAESHK